MRRQKSLCLALAALAATMAESAVAQTCGQRIDRDCIHAKPAALPRAKFAYGSTEDGDAWVARFDPGAAAALWRTTVGGAGPETVEAIALRADGKELLVAGGSGSDTIDGFRGRGHGGRDGIVFRLDTETGRLVGGAFVGTAADDLLTGVAEGLAGEVLVAGASSVLPPAIGRPPAELTQLAVADPAPGAATTLAFVSSLGPGGDAELFRHPLGPIAAAHPRIWLDCHGRIVVGVAFSQAAPCNGNWPDLVYEQDQIAQDYSLDTDWSNPLLGSPPGGFGFHALRWKEYHANATANPPFVLDWSLVSTPQVPKNWSPACADAGTLNTLETQLLLQNGVPTDPPGGWVCGSHADLGELALLAAHLHTRWGTPVYTHFGFWENLSTSSWLWWTHPVAIEQVVFEPYCLSNPNAYQGETVDDLCNLGVDNAFQLTCTTSSAIPGIAGTGFYLKLKRFEGAEWGVPAWSNRPVWWDPNTAFFWQEWYAPGEYLMDPPAGAADEVAILTEAARQLSGLVARDGRVRATRIEGGVATCSEVLAGALPAGE